MQPLFTRTSIANIDLGVVCIATARKPDRDKMRKSKIKKTTKKGCAIVDPTVMKALRTVAMLASEYTVIPDICQFCYTTTV